MFYDGVTSSCACEAGYYKDASDNCAQCPGGTSNNAAGGAGAMLGAGTIAGVCDICADVTQLYDDSDATAPACNPCGANKELNGASDACVCATGYNDDVTAGTCVMDFCLTLTADGLSAQDAKDTTRGDAQCLMGIVAGETEWDAMQDAVNVSTTNTTLEEAGVAGCTGLTDGEVCTIGDSGYQLTCNQADGTYTFGAVGSSGSTALAPVVAVFLALSSM